ACAPPITGARSTLVSPVSGTSPALSRTIHVGGASRGSFESGADCPCSFAPKQITSPAIARTHVLAGPAATWVITHAPAVHGDGSGGGGSSTGTLASSRGGSRVHESVGSQRMVVPSHDASAIQSAPASSS